MDVGRTDINGLLSQMRNIKAQTANTSAVNPLGNEPAGIQQTKGPASPKFGEMFNNAINAVNDTQSHAKEMATAYERGDQGVSLSQVMVASQKASVSFEATMQVRNKLVEAYKDVMNMPI